MPRAVYRLYATFDPAKAGGDLAESICAIGAALPTRDLETAVNRQSRLATRITVESAGAGGETEAAATPPLLKDAIAVMDLRIRARRRTFEKWNFASVHSQLAEAEKALTNHVKYRLDEELRNAGQLNGARLEISAQLVGSSGFFGSRGRWLYLVLGALLGAAAIAAAAHQGVDVAGAVGRALAELEGLGVRLR